MPASGKKTESHIDQKKNAIRERLGSGQRTESAIGNKKINKVTANVRMAHRANTRPKIFLIIVNQTYNLSGQFKERKIFKG